MFIRLLPWVLRSWAHSMHKKTILTFRRTLMSRYPSTNSAKKNKEFNSYRKFNQLLQDGKSIRKSQTILEGILPKFWKIKPRESLPAALPEPQLLGQLLTARALWCRASKGKMTILNGWCWTRPSLSLVSLLLLTTVNLASSSSHLSMDWRLVLGSIVGGFLCPLPLYLPFLRTR